MAYGTYSEVYFAVNVDNPKQCKIGETTNARRRSNQLFEKEGLWITRSQDIGGNRSLRLFVESAIRLKIQANYSFATLVGDDHFVCQEEKQVEFLEQQFYEMVAEALIFAKNFQKTIDK